MSWILKTFVKKAVVNEVGYKHNTRTGSDFIINDEKDFEQEKSRLIDLSKSSERWETVF